MMKKTDRRNHRLLLPLGLTAVAAFAAGPVGTWQGQVKTEKATVSVVFTIQQVSNIGEDAGVLDYGPPWDCKLKARYSGTGASDKEQLFSLTVPLVGATPGPHCKALIDGSLTAIADDSGGSLAIAVNTKNNEPKDQATLHPRPQ